MLAACGTRRAYLDGRTAPATIYLLRANSSFLWNQDIIHGILTVSVPIHPFWGQDIMAYLTVPILPSWGQKTSRHILKCANRPLWETPLYDYMPDRIIVLFFQRAVYYVLYVLLFIMNLLCIPYCRSLSEGVPHP